MVHVFYYSFKIKNSNYLFYYFIDWYLEHDRVKEFDKELLEIDIRIPQHRITTLNIRQHHLVLKIQFNLAPVAEEELQLN